MANAILSPQMLDGLFLKLQQSDHKDVELEQAFDNSILCEHMRENAWRDLMALIEEQGIAPCDVCIALFKGGIQLGWTLREQVEAVQRAEQAFAKGAN